MTYGDDLSLREARERFFDANGFSEAQYGDRWVPLRFGRWTMWFPNTRGRQRAVPYHDLHHVLTGYATDWYGESEISAWEVASGCRDYLVAWALNLSGIVMGLVIAPRRTVRAFLRGRRSGNLYGQAVNDALLDERIGTLRQRLGLTDRSDRMAA